MTPDRPTYQSAADVIRGEMDEKRRAEEQEKEQAVVVERKRQEQRQREKDDFREKKGFWSSEQVQLRQNIAEQELARLNGPFESVDKRFGISASLREIAALVDGEVTISIPYRLIQVREAVTGGEIPWVIEPKNYQGLLMSLDWNEAKESGKCIQIEIAEKGKVVTLTSGSKARGNKGEGIEVAFSSGDPDFVQKFQVGLHQAYKSPYWIFETPGDPGNY